MAELGANGLSFRPTAGFSTVGLKTLGDEPLKLTSGRWYYEVTIGDGPLKCPQFGWCDERFKGGRNSGVGDDTFSWGIDGHRVKKWHGSSDAWGQEWKAGDVLGCMADLDAKTLSFSLNGSTDAPMGLAFEVIEFQGGVLPALTANACSAVCNFGEDPAEPLKFLPEGYSSIASPNEHSETRGRLVDFAGQS